MGFWQNVDDECEFQGITRKELAQKAKFSVNTISNGIRRDGMPAADLALKISKVLNVPLERLLEWKENEEAEENSVLFQNERLFLMYLPIIKEIESLKENSKKALFEVIKNLK